MKNETTDPQWIRPKDVPALFGISRPATYNLLATGKIKTVSLKEKGKASGSRLISYHSLKDYFDKLAEEQNQTVTK